MAGFLEAIPLELVGSLSSQSLLGLPRANWKNPDEIPEFQPIRSLFRRFLPEELLKWGSTYVAHTDQEASRSVEWWSSTGQVPDWDAITLLIKQNVLDKQLGLTKNLGAHTARADQLLEKFHSEFLSRLIKS